MQIEVAGDHVSRGNGSQGRLLVRTDFLAIGTARKVGTCGSGCLLFRRAVLLGSMVLLRHALSLGIRNRRSGD